MANYRPMKMTEDMKQPLTRRLGGNLQMRD